MQRPYFMGMRFEMRPSPWVDFAAQRTGGWGEWRARIAAGTLNRAKTDPLQPAGQSTTDRAYGFLEWERGL